MKKIAIVTDSTAVINCSFKERNDNLYIIPLHILFSDDEIYSDGVDLNPDDFFELVNNKTVLPTTSQPSVGEVLDLFEELTETYDEIIYITISSNISGTYNTGLLAAKQLSNKKIEVFDSLNTSVIQKHFVEEAIRLAELGKDVNYIVKHLENLRNQSEIYLVVDNLSHLSRNGRLNNISAFVGSLLKIKPILRFENGYINLKKKVRTLRKAYSEVINLMVEADIDDNSVIMIAHANGRDYADKVKSDIQKIHPSKTIEICELSPVISVHTGPNTVGVAWVKK